MFFCDVSPDTVHRRHLQAMRERKRAMTVITDPIRCFMKDTDQPWGDQDVGAIGWWDHERFHSANDTAPRPMPHLAVMTPGGLVCLDCPVVDPGEQSYWVYFGAPPDITVTTSINVKNAWHGHIRQGEMT